MQVRIPIMQAREDTSIQVPLAPRRARNHDPLQPPETGLLAERKLLFCYLRHSYFNAEHAILRRVHAPTIDSFLPDTS